MSYDVRGRKMQMSDPNMGLWKYAYNVLGELIWQRDAAGNTSTLSYDTASNGKGSIREIKYTDNSHRKTFTYNVYGDLASRETTTDSKTVKETYSYDSHGRPTTTAYAFAGVTRHLVKRDYSANLGFLYRIQQDADASGSTYGYTTVWEANAMDAWGNHTIFTLGNGARTARHYSEENGYLESIRTAFGSDASNAIQDSTFVFDRIGNLVARSSKAGWGTSQSMEEYHYFDHLNRLVHTYANGWEEEALHYDKAGNIVARHGVGQYVYDSTQPNAVDSIRDPQSGSTLHSYTYNANGSMTSRAGKTITWTTFNKPHQVKNGTTVLSEFRYGFDRERIRQDTPEGDIYYFGGVEWSWNAASTSDTEARIYLNAPSGRVGLHLKDASLVPSETRYFHADHLGSIELVTNHLGEVIDRLSYTPWGQRRQDVWTHGNSFHKGVERRGFTGHEHLAYADFELIHMNGRVYDPVLARFVSADPFADGLAASQSLNRYAYVGNNPVSLTDPSGHFIGIILGFAFGHLTTSVTAKVVLGAVIGGLQTAISGGDWEDVLQGAALGGVAAGIAHGIGQHFGHNPSVFDFGNEFGRSLAHGLGQGGLHEVAGGGFGDGFLGGFFGSVGSPGFGNTFDTRSSRLFAAVVIGGTASELGGGKFGNGALSAAFVAMFGQQSKSKELQEHSIVKLDEGTLTIEVYQAYSSADNVPSKFEHGILVIRQQLNADEAGVQFEFEFSYLDENVIYRFRQTVLEDTLPSAPGLTPYIDPYPAGNGPERWYYNEGSLKVNGFRLGRSYFNDHPYDSGRGTIRFHTQIVNSITNNTVYNLRWGFTKTGNSTINIHPLIGFR